MRIKAPLWDTQEIAQRILWQADDLIAFNKPYDWPTSGRTLNDDDCVQFHLINYLRQQGLIKPTAKHPRGMVWAVHQLDADTSGLLLFTTEKKAVHHYHQLLTSPDTEKRYLAIVAGTPDWECHSETAPMGLRTDKSRGLMPLADGGKPAHTDFQLKSLYENHSVLGVRLHTGRTHQIRIHLHHMGFPLLGEEWYGTNKLHFRQALHAHSISIPGIPDAPVANDLLHFL